MSCITVPINIGTAIAARELLKDEGHGNVVEVVENHYEFKEEGFITKFEDSTHFSQAYLDDMLEALPVAWKQNQRLLSQFDLADCLRD